ncbi:hypothetical protein BD324DRAFT_656282 [Kockovaella imperatae]|uniref:Uncharacterized protein n=1 Tax=Kockovaella imperatae TaxID=4999 RepID=A0A1Y1UGG6_9TREE|nr:hypothetical protein BD324DRAFT_656282 [Kockovaella imperatae]ORX37069.1 hypothetical protein BD324DRAFT_656282 [Kockovaella imperatae]
MALRMDDSDKLANNVKPGGMQSTGEHAQGVLDTAASYLPGQSKPGDALNDDAASPNMTHDTGRQGGLDAFKTSGNQGPIDYLKTKMDQGASNVQTDKSATQQLRDTMTPGNAGIGEQPNQGPGLMDRAAGAMNSVKESIMGPGHDSPVSVTRHEEL